MTHLTAADLIKAPAGQSNSVRLLGREELCRDANFLFRYHMNIEPGSITDIWDCTKTPEWKTGKKERGRRVQTEIVATRWTEAQNKLCRPT